jgi:guanylate kinase
MGDQVSNSLLIVISGPSGVGKDSVLEQMRLLKEPWHYVVTATTRHPRPGENDGIEYIFLKQELFNEMIHKNEFLEYANVYGNQYGIPKNQVEEAMGLGKDVIAKTDIQGARTLKGKVPNSILIFIAPPSIKELERRLKERKTSDERDLRRRLATAKEEMQSRGDFDHVIVNHSGYLEKTVASIRNIIEEAKRDTKSGGFE